MVYDYLLTLDDEMEYIWKRPLSGVTIIYIMLRYCATLFMITDAAGAYNGVYTDIKTCAILHIWLACVIFWIVQVILQLRVYALYHGSKRIVVAMVVGFAIEVTCMLFALIKLTILYVHDASPPSTVFSVPGVSTIIYLSCGMLAGYECLLFVLAFWQACIRHSEGKPIVECWTGSHLADIIIKGNMIYFFINMFSVFVYILGLKPTILHVSSV